MAIPLKQSTERIIRVGPFVDKTDGVTPETGITLGAADQAELLKATGATVDISGATWAAISGVDGWYNLTLTTSHTDTLGEVTVVVQDSSVCLAVFMRGSVIPANVYDSLYSTDKLQVDVTQWNGMAVSTPNTAGVPVTDVKYVAGTSQTANDNGADINTLITNVAAILADTAELQGDFTNTGRLDTILDSILTDTAEIGAAGAGLTALGGMGATMRAQVRLDAGNLLTAEVSAVTSQTVFTLGSGADFDDAYNNMPVVLYDDSNNDYISVRTVSDYVGSTKQVTIDSGADFTLGTDDSVGIFITAPGTTPPTAAQVRAEIDSNSTQLSAIVADTNEIQGKLPSNYLMGSSDVNNHDDEIDDILTDTGELQAEWANGGRLDLILDARAAQTTVDNIETDTQDIQGRLPAALATGRMSSDAVAISGSTAAADNLEAAAEVAITGTAQSGTLSTTQMSTDLSEGTDDHYNGRLVTWTSGALSGQQTDITDYTGSGGILTYTATTEAPSAGDTFVIS